MSDNLIQLIIKEDFGDSAAKVANLLVQNGELSLIDLVAQSKLSFDEMKHVVVVLIKHNIIYFVNKANPSNVGQSQPLADMIEDYVYRISLPDILFRLRFPKILFHISKMFGLCQMVMEAFIESGRLTVTDCVAEIEEHMKLEGIEGFSEKEVLEAISTLIKGQYIAQVDQANYSADLYSLSKTEKPDIGRGKRRAKAALKESETKGKRTKKSKANPIDEINMLSSDGLTQDIKARLGQLVEKDKLVLNADKEAAIKQKNEKVVKEDYTKTSPLFYDSTNNEEYMFKISYRKFIHDFRTEYILEVVSSRINEQASLVIQAMLKDSQLFSRASQFKQAEIYTLTEIMEKLAMYKGLKEESVNNYLQLLQAEKFVQRVKNPNPKIVLPSYCVDMDFLVSKLQIKSLEKIIEDKFSKNHARVFRLLDNLGYLDEKQISDTGLMPIKQARTCVMELIAFRAVDSQDLPGEQGKINQVYGARPQQALANLIEEIYKTLFNLKKREEIEMTRLNSMVEVHASEDDQDKTRELINKLESAIIELDDTLMLFCEF